MGRLVIVLALMAACGRLGFELHADLDASATSDGELIANYAFVTSTRQLPTTFGSDLAGADAICNARAAAAALPGTYVAWLSTTTIDAADRLAGSRGWIRTDGKPFADRVEDLIASTIYYPLNRDENGVEVSDFVLTGTDDTGRMLPGNCADYTNSGASIYFGRVEATAHGWTHESTVPCDMQGRIYCFGLGRSQPVNVVPATGRTAFLTMASFIPDANGLATADALCASEASGAGLAGTYRALLATTTATAISRFSLAGATWVRTDGVPLSDSTTAFANNMMTAPLNVTAMRSYRIANAYTGATSVTAKSGSAVDSCASWTAANGTSLIGLPSYIGSSFFYYSPSNASCAGGLPIYCLQE